jgi:hypothetical protein
MAAPSMAATLYGMSRASSLAAAGTASGITPAVVVAICALTVSVLALGFTVLSWWWLNARRGGLRTYRPHSFAAALTPQDLLINVPLVFHNTGAAPIVVQDLRLRLHKNPAQRKNDPSSPDRPPVEPLVMWWRATRRGVQPEPGARPMPATFPVEGRNAVQQCIEFGLRQPTYVPRNGPYTTMVEGKLGHRTDWVELLSFDLHTEHVHEGAGYIAYSNDPQWSREREVLAYERQAAR